MILMYVASTLQIKGMSMLGMYLCLTRCMWLHFNYFHFL